MESIKGEQQSGRILEMFEVPYERAVNAVYGLARDPEGRMYVAFSGALEGYKPPRYTVIVTRLDAQNNLDKGYGEQGFTTIDFFRESGLQLQAMVLQDEGSVVLIAYGHARTAAGLVKLDASGRLDQAFGNGGSIIHYLRDSPVSAAPVTYANITPNEHQDSGSGSNARLISQSSNALICCGGFSHEGKELVVVAKFRPDGSLDRTFGQDGVTEISSPRTEVYRLECRAVAELSDGRMVVFGSAYIELPSGEPPVRGWICRCLPDGVVDQTFGDKGHLIIGAPEGTSNVSRVECGAVAQGPEFSLACVSNITVFDPGAPLNLYSQVSFLDQNGVDLYSFNAGKPVIFDVVSHEIDFLHAVAVGLDNRIVAAGECTSGTASGRPEMLVARFNTDGSRDTSFAGQGWFTEAYKGGFHKLRFIMLERRSIVVLGGNNNAATVTVIRN
ncbi:delta-60 repeat domain-containing protein [Pseudomonas sp. Pseusp122]|uniref:delta-60 repeat domain-containing protein n=1 Tax=unclassified Pseudomonas TaxID=196821 RepID=UPI0039A49BC3